MRPARLAAMVALPLLAGCQSLSSDDPAARTPVERLQGMIVERDGRWQMQPCDKPPAVALEGNALAMALGKLRTESAVAGPLFADLGGSLSLGRDRLHGNLLSVRDVYRLDTRSACDDPMFSRLLIRAEGQQPSWRVSLTRQGMLLEHAGQPPQAMPFLEEQLPDGSRSLTSEGDQTVELWVRPTPCLTADGAQLTAMSAELRLDGERLLGCAYPGARTAVPSPL